MRSSFLPFALPDLGQAELEEIKAVLDSGWLSTGPKVRQFEKAFAAYVGTEHAVAMNSCTAAMHLALEAIGLSRGDYVITTPYTFASTAEVICYADAIPVFVDVEPNTLNIDVQKLSDAAEALKSNSPRARDFLPPALRNMTATGTGTLRAIIPVHIAGYPCDLDRIRAIAARVEVPVIEDAAHAFGAKYNGSFIGCAQNGGLLSAACFSFYATKTMTTGEGGMLCTSSAAIADRCRMMSLHGVSKDAWKRYSSDGTWYYEILAPGFKYNMTDLAAALGIVQLGKAERMRLRRRQIAQRYDEAFRSIPEVQTPTDGDGCQHAWHLYMLRLNQAQLRIARAQFISELNRRRIGASVHFIPLHVHPYYRERYGYQPDDLPIAYQEYQRVISLPIYSKMSDRDVQDVIEAVTEIIEQHRVG